MKLLRHYSISLVIALVLLITTEGGAFAFIQQPPPDDLTAKADTTLMIQAPDVATDGPSQEDALHSAEELALDELTAGADSILVGTVTDMTAYEKDGRRGDIYTRVTLAVEETIKGTPTPQATIEV